MKSLNPKKKKLASCQYRKAKYETMQQKRAIYFRKKTANDLSFHDPIYYTINQRLQVLKNPYNLIKKN